MMLAATDPDMLIAELALGGMVAVFCWQLIGWVRDAPVKPDPWDAVTDEKLADPETQQVCHHCSTPQKSTAWFCPHCGSAVGQYNNMMPYVQIFSEGEVFRNGLNQPHRNRLLVTAGFTLMATAAMVKTPYLIPLFGLLIFKKLRRAEKPDEKRP
jgi:hypothetical protein